MLSCVKSLYVKCPTVLFLDRFSQEVTNIKLHENPADANRQTDMTRLMLMCPIKRLLYVNVRRKVG